MKMFLTTLTSLLFSCGCQPAHASPDEWSTSTRALTGLAMASAVADWGQTRDISKQPERFRELNPILGPHPSTSKVDAYFVGILMMQYLIADKVPEPYKSVALAVSFTSHLSAVRSNKSLGLKINFGF